MSYINCKKCNHLFDLDLISPFCPKCNTNNGTKDSEPKVVSVKHDDDTHSHYALIDSEGRKLWSENPEECAAQGYPVYDPNYLTEDNDDEQINLPLDEEQANELYS